MGYVIESSKEAERLSLQNSIPAYDYRSELANFNVSPGVQVLDLGCAAGEITTYLADRFPQAHFTGVDFSRERIGQAKTRSNCSFVCADASKLPFKEASFNWVLAQALYQHLDDPEAVTEEVWRILANGGKARIVESYHLMLGLDTDDSQLKCQIKLLGQNGSCDFDMALKVPGLLTRAGFEVANIQRVLWDFDDPEHRALEVANNRRRFEQSMPVLVQLFGDKKRATQFAENYLAACQDMGNRYWFEKHTITGVKHS